MRFLNGHPALLIEKPFRAVVVTDLHIGFEEELRQRGIMIPLQSIKIVEDIAQLVEETKAEKVIVVGDLKHNVTGPSRLEYEILPSFLKKLKRYVDEIIVIPGNHDGDLDRVLGDLAVFQPSRGMLIAEEGVGLTHGHVKPDKRLLEARIIVTGHLHPVLRIGTGEAGARLRVWLRLKAPRKALYKALYGEETSHMKGDLTLLIMPSFNNLLQGRSITDLSATKLVRGPLLNTGVFDIDKAEVITLDGVYLGSLLTLREQLS